MRVPIVDLVGRPGQSKPLRVSVSPAELVPAGDSDARWDPPGAAIQGDIELDARLESVVEGILVRGTADVDLVMACSRCLAEIVDEATVALTELYLDPRRRDEHPPTDGEDYLIDDDLAHLDLAPALRDALTLVVPLQPLCREDCAGLCPTCGANLDEVDCGHAREQARDPRWAALAELHLDDD